MSRLQRFFSDDYMAPHGFCFFWLPEILILHIVANVLIAVSYFSIPIALWYFAKKRPDMPFKKIFFLFAIFITLCGLTHVFGIIVLWYPYYGIEGIVMLMTGIASAFTAILVWKILPKALTLPSPTELQEINTRLSLTNAEIEGLVKTRTQELEKTNLDLASARERADEANRAKSDFLANMSHEIRTPMNVIIGIARIMKESEPLSQNQLEYLKTLNTSAQSLMALINDILDFAKIESGSMEMEYKSFNVHKVVEEIATLFRFQAKEKGLDFLLNIQADCIQTRRYMGDANRLRQILINLCGNAIKFTQGGSVTVDVSCKEIPGQNKDNIVIIVRDTGVGIPADKLDKIFDKFVQVDTSVTRRYGGSGLGLTISKVLVENMGGTISVESTSEKGSAFTVSIPFEIDATA